MDQAFLDNLRTELEGLKEAGLYKAERVITSAQQASITIVDELSRALNNMLEFSNSGEPLEVDETYDHRSILQAGLAEMLSSLK